MATRDFTGGDIASLISSIVEDEQVYTIVDKDIHKLLIESLDTLEQEMNVGDYDPSTPDVVDVYQRLQDAYDTLALEDEPESEELDDDEDEDEFEDEEEELEELDDEEYE